MQTKELTLHRAGARGFTFARRKTFTTKLYDFHCKYTNNACLKSPSALVKNSPKLSWTFFSFVEASRPPFFIPTSATTNKDLFHMRPMRDSPFLFNMRKKKAFTGPQSLYFIPMSSTEKCFFSLNHFPSSQRTMPVTWKC